MMKSTPVRCSSARMLRPSRPMMRPFMSSAGSWTTETVVSAAWPAASRCMTTERMLRTRRSASRFVSSSTWRTQPRRVVAHLVLELLEQLLLGLRRAHARRPLELADRLARARSISARASPSTRSRSASSAHAALDRLLAGEQALLERRSPPRGAPRGRRRSARRGRRRGGAAAAGRAARPASPGTRRVSSGAAATRPKATTTAAIRISIARSSPRPRPECPARALFSVWSGRPGRAPGTSGDQHERRPQAAASDGG